MQFLDQPVGKSLKLRISGSAAIVDRNDREYYQSIEYLPGEEISITPSMTTGSFLKDVVAKIEAMPNLILDVDEVKHILPEDLLGNLNQIFLNKLDNQSIDSGHASVRIARILQNREMGKAGIKGLSEPEEDALKNRWIPKLRELSTALKKQAIQHIIPADNQWVIDKNKELATKESASEGAARFLAELEGSPSKVKKIAMDSRQLAVVQNISGMLDAFLNDLERGLGVTTSGLPPRP